MVRRQSSFSRTRGNDLRMGAFYTDVEHCMSIGEMLNFSKTEETCVLEPSIGDGSAVFAVTGVSSNEAIKIFGVELNDAVAKETKESPFITECLSADFLEGTRLQKQSFSFCFGNPPYQTDNLTEDGSAERVERQFLRRVTDVLQKSALLVWVIPYHIMVEPGNFKFLVTNYDILTCYRFRPSEYIKYKQVVIVARKKQDKTFLLKQEVEEYFKPYAYEENIPVLPEHPEERFDVPTSDSSKVTVFTERKFNASKAMEKLADMSTDSMFDDLNELICKKITQEEYVRSNVGRPPIPPKKDTLYLMATSGYGAGLTGSEETNDLHLQRGVAEVIEESVFETDPKNPEKMIERVTSRTQITMTVIENNGRITALQ